MEKKYMFILLWFPLLLFVAAFALPLFYGVLLSLKDTSGNFVGVTNYVSVLTDQRFWGSLGFTFFFAFVVVGLMTTLGLLFGVFINHLTVGQNLVKSSMLIPWAISLTAWGLLGQIVFSKDYGIVNHLLMVIGLIDKPVVWLADPGNAKFAIIASRIYKDVWFGTLLFLVARQGISGELYEEAKVSGATGRFCLWHITIPLLRPTILYVGIINMIFSLHEFDQVYALTKGGPGFATETAAMGIYKHGMLFGNYEIAIAQSILWSIFIGTLAVIIFVPGQLRSLRNGNK